MRLADKTVLITGAAAGIGRAAAARFAREGARVAMLDIDATAGEAAAEEIRRAGGTVRFLDCNVTDESAVERAVAAVRQAFGGIHGLFACAGGSLTDDRHVHEVDMAVWEHTIALDLKGPFLMCRHVVPALIEAGGGAIVTVSSVVALRGNFPGHVYTAAKGGVIAFTRALAGAYAKSGIRANVVCPGIVRSERVKQRSPAQDQLKAAAARDPSSFAAAYLYPFGVGDPDDIANVALFLLSDEARMVTGAVIPADSGISAY